MIDDFEEIPGSDEAASRAEKLFQARDVALDALRAALDAPDDIAALKTALDAVSPDVLPTPESDALTRAAESLEAYQAGEIAELTGLRRAFANARRALEARSATPAPSIRPLRDALNDPMPTPILSATGQPGAVLSAGEICVLTGQGGVGKSLLNASLALAFASNASAARRPLPGGIFDGWGGGVVIAAYEDRASILARRLASLTEIWREEASKNIWDESKTFDANPHLAALKGYDPDDIDQGFERLHVADMDGSPLFGPPDGGSYNARPIRLRGWRPLFEGIRRAAEQCGNIRLVIIDPALSAYVGESNAAVPPIREFYGALRRECEELGAGVLLVTHSTKAARKQVDPYDPGMVSGSGAWTDASRGVMTLTRDGDTETLAISKANWGASYIQMPLTRVWAPPTSNGHAAPIGFKAGAPSWTGRSETKNNDAAGYFA